MLFRSVYLFNFTTTIIDQLLESDTDVKTYIQECLNTLLQDKRIIIAMEGCLYYEQAAERLEIIQDRMQSIIAG